MAAYEYDDFRIRFTPVRGTHSYDLVADTPDGMMATAVFDLPLTDEDLRRAVMTLGRTRSITRDIGAPPPEQKVTAEQFGGRLAMSLLNGDVGRAYETARKRAVEAGRGLRLRLSFKDAPALLDVPWEFMYLKPTFLASQRRTPIVRFLETDSPVSPSRIGDKVRILGLVANPRGSQQLDVGSERSKVDTALEKVRKERDVDVDWLDPATPRRLRQTLQEGDYHILHFVGHSDFVGGEGVLLLEDENGGPSMVSAAQFVNLLGDQETLRLVVLNSCEGSRTDAADPFAGLATSIVGLGVPAVVAMQFEISDKAAITFAEELYHSLIARQDPVDAAVAEARKAVFTEVNEIEWATPVLFLRNDDGKLFTFDQPLKLPPPVPVLPITQPNPKVEPDAPTEPIAAAPVDTKPAMIHGAGTESTDAPPPPWDPGPPRGDYEPKPRPKRRVGLIVGVIIAALVLVGGGIGIAVVAGGDDAGGEATETTAPPTDDPTTPPTQPNGSTAETIGTVPVDPNDLFDPIDIDTPLQQGSQGGDVQKVQSYLIRVGIPVGQDGLDGDYGPVTADAVRQFQTSRGLVADGIVGEATAVQMTSWVGPRPRGDDMAIAAVRADGKGTNIFVVDSTTGVINQATTKSATDFDPAWNPHFNKMVFARSASDGDVVGVIVPSEGSDPRGGGDAGITVKTAAQTSARLPVWITESVIAFVAGNDIMRADLDTDADLVNGAAGDPTVLSGGWGEIRAMDADESGRLLVIGVGPDGTGRNGLWIVSDELSFFDGSESFVDVTFSRDGDGFAVIADSGTSVLAFTSGGTTASTSADQILQQGKEARPDLTLPSFAEFISITRAPIDSGATYAVLLRATDGTPGLPMIVLLDANLLPVDVIVPQVSPLENSTMVLDPAELADIVGLAG